MIFKPVYMKVYLQKT